MGLKLKVLKHFLAGTSERSYFFSLTQLLENCRQLTQLSNDRLKFIFPVKSFPNARVIEELAPIFAGFDVSNLNEYQLVERWVQPTSLIWSSSPSRWTPRLAGKIFLDGTGDREGWGQDVQRALRVRVAKSYQATPSRFGLDLSALTPELIKNWGVTALHFHHGELDLKEEHLLPAAKQLADFCKRCPQITHVNLGGGFHPLTLHELKPLIIKVMELFPEQTLIFEPGRWLCREAGFLLGKVTEVYGDSMELRCVTTLSRDCHLRWLREANVSISRQSSQNVFSAPKLWIGGETCHESDWLARLESNEPMYIARGDVIVVDGITGYNVGWNQSFNGIPAADLVFIEE